VACPATTITVINSNILISQQGEHAHRNGPVERKAKEVESKNIAVVALFPLVIPYTILEAILANLEATMPRTSAYISNRNAINQVVHKKSKMLKGCPPKAMIFEDLADIPDQFSKREMEKPSLS
jgi:hypothetical protein